MFGKRELYTVKNRYTEDEIHQFISSMNFMINAIGYQSYGHICENRVCTDLEIIYIIEGEDEIEIEDNLYNYKAGDLFVIPPFVSHSIRVTNQGKNQNHWIHLDITPYYKIEQFIENIMGGKKLYKCHIGNSEELNNLFYRLEQEHSKKIPGYIAMKNSIFMEIVIFLLRFELNKNEEKN